MADKDGKTEKPTPKRLRDARNKGELTKSPELSSALTFAIFSLVIIPLWQFVLKQAFVLLKINFDHGFMSANMEQNVNYLGWQSLVRLLIIIGPFLLLGFLSSWLVNLGQVGFLLTGKPLKPDFKRLNPISGFKNIFSSKALFSLIKNIIKLIIIFHLSITEVKGIINQLLEIQTQHLPVILDFLLTFIRTLSLKIAGVLFVLGVFDYVYQRFMFRKNLRMSKQDIKDEYKEQEGDPFVKSQRRAQYQQLVRGAVKNVKDATVVIKNPTHLAIALRYESGVDEAPVVLAKGADYLAQKIREEATLNKIPLIENKPVARSLYKTTEIGEAIPLEMYEAIAEVLAIVYQINERNKHKI